MCNLVTIGQVVSEKKLFESLDERRTTEPAYPINFLGAFGSGDLKRPSIFSYLFIV